MRAAGAPSVLATFIVVAIASTADWPVSARGGHGQLGKPLEGLTMDERKKFRDGKEEFEAVETAAQGLGPIFKHSLALVRHSEIEGHYETLSEWILGCTDRIVGNLLGGRSSPLLGSACYCPRTRARTL